MGEFYIVRDELYHHGIKGQKHGQRNGPPYPLQPADHSASERKAGWRKSLKGGAKKAWEKAKEAGQKVNDSGVFEQSIKTKNGKISPAEKISRDATNATRNVAKIQGYLQEGKLDKQRAATQKEASQLSDAELQRRINRMQLEQRYAQLSQPQISKGSARVERALNIAVTSLEIGASAVAIAAGVQALRRPKSE